MASDVIQSFGFIADLHWFAIDSIGTVDRSCTAQGFFIQLGDAATAFFVILIACHTLKHFITPTNPKLPVKFFRAAIVLVWTTCLLMATIPRVIHHDFYGDVGVWCWIQPKYIWSRLYLHYAYLFLAEFVSILIYGGLGIYLWLYGKQANSSQMRRVAKSMFAYPIAYTFGTLPLASVRVRAMAGKSVSKKALVGACIVFSMLGSINCAVYVLTRRKMMLRERENRSLNSARRVADGAALKTENRSPVSEDDFDLELSSAFSDTKYVANTTKQASDMDRDITSVTPIHLDD